MLRQATHIIKQPNLLLMAGLIIALPFAAGQSLMFPTQSAKFILFGLCLIGISALFFIGIILKKPGRHIRLTGLDLALAAYFIYCAVSVLANADRHGVPDRFWELTDHNSKEHILLILKIHYLKDVIK